MTQAGKAVIDQQEGTEAGASGDDLGAPFSLTALCKERTYSPPPSAGGGMACGHRAPSGGAGVAPPSASPPAGIYQQTPTAACASDAAVSMRWGLGGASATNKLRQVYTGALLATTIRTYK